jgi:putative ABC transport system permease protein
LLVNTTGAFRNDRKIKIQTPFDAEIGTELEILPIAAGVGEYRLDNVTISAITGEIPSIISGALFDGSQINIFLPESVYDEFSSTHAAVLGRHAEIAFAVSTPDPDAYMETLNPQFSDIFERDGVNLYITNIAQMTRFNQNITLLVEMFGYGFIAMLSLIAVTSVIATISTGMALRRQEFAMLYSVGMTPEGMDKMLNLESLMYGLRSLLIGLPVGAVISYLIYMGVTNTFEFPYELPWRAMVISAAAVMLLTFATMRYGRSKLRGISIADALRSETA